MSSHRHDARLIIGRPGGPTSAVWRLVAYKNEVYLATANSGGIEKLSFHSSGICRKAFTTQRGAPAGMSDRVTVRWKRGATPPAHSGRGSCVFELGVPTDYLTVGLALPSKPLTWIEAAPPHMTTALEMFFTGETEESLFELMGQDRVVWCAPLPSGERFVVSRRDATFVGEDFYVPASHHAQEDILFVKDDPATTGRPIRITIFATPKDGDRMTAWEYGGYRGVVTPEMSARGIGTFTRKELLDRS